MDNVQERCKCLMLSDDQLREIMARMEDSFAEGLHPETANTAAVKMLPAYIRAVSVSDERGEYLALDLGGTNFRVLLITLEGETKSNMTSKIYDVPENIQKGSGTELFDHIAACLAQFMEDHGLKEREKLPLGFTFSFPCRQDGLTSASLVNWTKGFNASGVVGEDVAQLLRQACQRRGDIDIDVVAVLNDTTGTMLACSFLEKHCYIGAIIGTGSNACYMETLDKIPKLQGQIHPEEDGLPAEMCINTEWGAFGDDGKLEDFLTIWDRQLDQGSINPGKQRLEKAVSGMYMGEIVRLVLEDLTKQGLLFGGSLSPIGQPGCFSTRLVSSVEKQMQGDDDDKENRLHKIEEKLQEIGVWNATASDCANVAHICSLVSSRAAHLCACGIAALLKRMNRPFVTVGVDGSVYRFHPTFKDLLNAKIDELVDGRKHKFTLVLSEDGSGRGAAVAAAVATRMTRMALEHRTAKTATAESNNTAAEMTTGNSLAAAETTQTEFADALLPWELLECGERLEKRIGNMMKRFHLATSEEFIIKLTTRPEGIDLMITNRFRAKDPSGSFGPTKSKTPIVETAGDGKQYDLPIYDKLEDLTQEDDKQKKVIPLPRNENIRPISTEDAEVQCELEKGLSLGADCPDADGSLHYSAYFHPVFGKKQKSLMNECIQTQPYQHKHAQQGIKSDCDEQNNSEPSSKCGECRAALMGSCVFAEGKRFHRDCFRCSKCQHTMHAEDGGYGLLMLRYHVNCGKILCAMCYAEAIAKE